MLALDSCPRSIALSNNTRTILYFLIRVFTNVEFFYKILEDITSVFHNSVFSVFTYSKFSVNVLRSQLQATPPVRRLLLLPMRVLERQPLRFRRRETKRLCHQQLQTLMARPASLRSSQHTFRTVSRLQSERKPHRFQ